MYDLCSFSGCTAKQRTRGMCQKHYESAKRLGAISIIRPYRQPLIERLLTNSQINLKTGCIEYKHTNPKGYGRISVNGQLMGAHRAVWQAEYGTIPEGMCVLHRCDNPPCINLGHLFLGTQTENIEDMDSKGRRGTTPGEKSGIAKLTTKDIQKILSDQRPQRIIAAHYKISLGHVSRIKAGTCWKHITDSTPFVGKCSHHGPTKLTHQQIAGIRSDPRISMDIATDYGISSSHVRKLKRDGRRKPVIRSNVSH
jgi:HNH endonuclease